MAQESSSAQVALLIPALNPDRRLLELLTALADSWNGPILLVDDGSREDCREIFAQAQALGCDVVRHARNLGKGRGLKTGFNHLLTHYPAAIGCVTADADGQHTPDDINACADALRAHPVRRARPQSAGQPYHPRLYARPVRRGGDGHPDGIAGHLPGLYVPHAGRARRTL